MAQVESYQVPAHPSGLEMRTQLNAIVLAIIGDNAGPNEPVETYPGMMWGDTTSNMLRRRTNANDGWVTIGPIDDFLGEMRTGIVNAANAANNRVLKSGDTMTGSLTLSAANLMFSNSASQWFGYMGSYGAAGQGGSGLGFVNSALNLWNMQVANDGTFYHRGSGTIDGGLRVVGGRLELRQALGAQHGEISMYSTDGTVMFLRGRASGGGMEWVNNDYNNVPMSVDNAGNLTVTGELWLASGGSRVAANGNVYGGVWGGWLSDWVSARLNERANMGARIQWDSGVNDFGPISDFNAAPMPAPWVVCGLSGGAAATANAIRVLGVVLRNQ